jgi:hypothetical protein
MILYNVTVKVDPSIADSWVYWMKAEHMPDLMGTDLFIDCRLAKLLEQDESDGITYAAQYYCEGMEQYEDYIANHADNMREKAAKMFGGKFVAFRTIMEII